MNVIVRTGKRQRSYIGATAYTTQQVVDRPCANIRQITYPKRPKPAPLSRSAKTFPTTLVTASTPPKVVVVQARTSKKRPPFVFYGGTVAPRTPPLPKTFSRPLIVPRPVSLKKKLQQPIALITRRDKGAGITPPRTFVYQPPRKPKSAGKITVLKSPGTAYPFTRPFVCAVPRRVRPYRPAISLKTSFYPSRPLQVIRIVAPAPRVKKKAGEIKVVSSRPIQPNVMPWRPIVLRAPRAPKPGKIVIIRNKVPNDQRLRPRPLVVPATNIKRLPSQPIRFSSLGFLPAPRPPQTRIILGRPAPLPRPKQPYIIGSWRRSGSQIPVPPCLVIAPSKPKLKRSTTFSRRYALTSPRGTAKPPTVTVIGAPKQKRRLPPKPIMIQTPRHAAGLPVDLPDAVCTWLLNQPRFVDAFSWSEFNQCISADWDDPQGNYPYLVYREPLSDRDYESQGGYEEDSQFEMAVISDSKEIARELGKLVGQILNDAPLEFVDGSVFYFRWRNPGFPPTRTPGTQDESWVWRRILLFDYKVEGKLPS